MEVGVAKQIGNDYQTKKNMTFRHEETPQGGRFFISANHENYGYIDYEWQGDVMAITHTVVAPAHQGKGIAKMLLDEVARYARLHQKKLRAVCPYVVKMFARYAAYDDVKVE